MTLLEGRGVTVRFGGVTAVNAVDLKLERGQVLSLIGPNGAGKTTLFNVFTGIYTPEQGEVLLGGRSIKGLKPYQITRQGLARTFQNIRLFRSMTALENCLVARHSKGRAGLLSAFLPLPAAAREEKENRAAALAALEFVGLAAHAHLPAGSLPYGQQRRLEIARALATGATTLLLDEPAAGMNPQETKDLMQLIARLRERGLTVLLIEHDMHLVMEISDQVAVLDHGKKIAEGTPAQVRRDRVVIQAYLGRQGEHATAH
ncbi:MAG TPA: ABC transporter ATP-binding protein [Firmicutes bacterium]|nr:ABC transporter ATP-binding protein [Bacillota bacterium]